MTSIQRRRNIDARKLVDDFVDLHDDDPIVKRRGFDNDRGVLGIGSRVEVAVLVRLLGADENDVGHQIHEQPSVELDVGMDGADREFSVLEKLRKPQALRSGEGKVDLFGDAEFEQREVLRPADARDDQVQVVDLSRIDSGQ